ncbi:MAG: flavodoxin-dependent (E)-4-hydroxy-3-methylbut-2-enyl-diphosphate synthase [Kiritimatiellae bacterium]|nr:flavodoxin-dependent (E)-4-hydroxy-3-methylbut-2-enyl-diphosphate synthase [Kiritimatiellia bacterium]
MRQSRAMKAGSLAIGGGARVSVQTMSNIDPHDAKALLAQVKSCAALGCDIFRLTVPDLEAAKVLGEVRKESPLPLVADIHFDYRLALAAIEAGVDKLRLNPGNIGSRDRVQAVARAAKARGIPIRIGVNLGSLERDLSDRLYSGETTPRRIAEALAESALRHLKLLEDEGFYDVVISAKASNVASTLATYRLLAERTDCPLHIGVTEAGTLFPGTIRSSVALGILLSEGIGDTLRVSLTDKPEREVRAGIEILRSLGLREPGPAITSCPTCGRTKVDLFRIAAQVEDAMEAYSLANPDRAVPHVAVMGCAVNGPGEAKGADVALCGGAGEFLLYIKGKAVAKVSEEDAVRKVMEYVDILR